jgi:exodeoxyribonuclease VII large subunit
MAEIIEGKKTYSLLDLAQSIERMFSAHFTKIYWVRAEMNKLNYYSHSGHCYPELLQKENGKTVVEFKSILWKNDYDRINRLFLEHVKEPLKDGIKILCAVSVNYSPQHGLSLRICDIDIGYTLGDIEAEKKEAIETLKREGLFLLNKSKTHALLPKRVAVISVESSKGFADFQEIIDAHDKQFTIFRMLFPALLQGDKAVESILNALKRVHSVSHHFDLVAIIRGGGGDVGLSCFNNYRLGRAIAQFPIPVYTGIGHSTNETVCEMVSHYNGITPTKVAQHILDQFLLFESRIVEATRTIIGRSNEILISGQHELHLHSRILQQATIGRIKSHEQAVKNFESSLQKSSAHFIQYNQSQLGTLTQRIPTSATFQLSTADERLSILKRQLLFNASHILSQAIGSLNHLERMVAIADPHTTLLKGFSITYREGVPIREASDLQVGDKLKTVLSHGNFESEVTFIQSN